MHPNNIPYNSFTIHLSFIQQFYRKDDSIYFDLKVFNESGVETYNSKADPYFSRSSVRFRWNDTTFPPCFNEAVPLVPFGRSIRLRCPPDLAYYKTGHKQYGIGPNEFVVFHVDVHPIERQYLVRDVQTSKLYEEFSATPDPIPDLVPDYPPKAPYRPEQEPRRAPGVTHGPMS